MRVNRNISIAAKYNILLLILFTNLNSYLVAFRDPKGLSISLSDAVLLTRGESDSLLPEIWFGGLGDNVSESTDEEGAIAVVVIGDVVDKRPTLPKDTPAAAAAAAAAAEEAPKRDGGAGRTIPWPPGPAAVFADK